MEICELLRDSTRINAGDWVDNIPGLNGVRLKVRGLDSRAYQTAMSDAFAALPDSERTAAGGVRQDAAQRVTRQLLADHILLDWDGLTHKGAPFPFDQALAREWLTSDSGALLVTAVIGAASKLNDSRIGVEDIILKN